MSSESEPGPGSGVLIIWAEGSIIPMEPAVVTGIREENGKRVTAVRTDDGEQAEFTDGGMLFSDGVTDPHWKLDVPAPGSPRHDELLIRRNRAQAERDRAGQKLAIIEAALATAAGSALVRMRVGFGDQYELEPDAPEAGRLPLVGLTAAELAGYEAALGRWEEWQRRLAAGSRWMRDRAISPEGGDRS